MAVIEADLETSLKTLFAERLASVESLNGTNIRIQTAWGYAPDGEVKGESEPRDEIVIAIAAGAMAWDQYLVPSCSIPVAVTIDVRRECAPTGRELANVMEPVAEILAQFQLNYEAATALSSENFTVDGVRLDGGDAPQFIPSSNIWRITRTFTVRGTIDCTITP